MHFCRDVSFFAVGRKPGFFARTTTRSPFFCSPLTIFSNLPGWKHSSDMPDAQREFLDDRTDLEYKPSIVQADFLNLTIPL